MLKGINCQSHLVNPRFSLILGACLIQSPWYWRPPKKIIRRYQSMKRWNFQQFICIHSLNSLCSASNKIKSRYDHSVLILFLLHLSTSLLAPENKMCHQIFRMLPECSSTLAMIESTILRLETWICNARDIEEQEECHISWIFLSSAQCVCCFSQLSFNLAPTYQGQKRSPKFIILGLRWITHSIKVLRRAQSLSNFVQNYAKRWQLCD